MKSNLSTQRAFLTVLTLAAAMASVGCQSWFGRGMRRVFLGQRQSTAQAAKVMKNTTPRLEISDGSTLTMPPASETNAATGAAADPAAPIIEEKPDYRVAVVTNPNDPMARYNLGTSYLEQGLLEEATFQFDMASSLDPTFAESYFMLGRTLRLRGQYDLAIAKFAAATKLNPGLAAAYVESGICWDQRGWFAKAREQYLAAIELMPANDEIYNNVGYSFFLDGEVAEAIKSYKRAIELNPNSVRAHSNLAMAYATKREYKKCFDHFRRAHGEAIANNNVGYLLAQEGRFSEAIAYYRRSLETNATSVRALVNMETALRATGQIDEAENIHAKFLQAQKVSVGSSPAGRSGESKAVTEQQ